MAEISENNIEWYTGDDTVTLSFSQKKYASKVLRYANSRSDVQIVAQNEDGSICAHIPLSWIKISPPRKGREFSEEEKAEAAERLRVAREKKKMAKAENIKE